jgi:hypothetical protein
VGEGASLTPRSFAQWERLPTITSVDLKIGTARNTVHRSRT